MNQIRKITVAVTAALVAGGTMAQPVLEEVIVTAQKRAESVQDVPSTVNVFNDEMLNAFNVQNFTDLAALTPGLAIGRNTGRSGSIALRGIPFDPSSAAEAAVAVFWNGSIVDGNAVFQQLFDLERVEILRGPQGTLQGRSSPAGAINIYTTKANVDEMEG
jgi:iron complex outermembrane receptor protein